MISESLDHIINHFERRSVSLVSPSAGTEYILDNPVPSNMVFVVLRMSIINFTDAYTQLRFGVRKTGLFQPVEEEKNPAANCLYILSEELLAFEGEQVGCEIVGATAGDVLRMYLEGYWKELQ